MTKYAQPDDIVKAIFEQHAAGVSARQIAKNINLSRDEIMKYTRLLNEQNFLNIDSLLDFLKKLQFTKNEALKIPYYPLKEQEEAYAYMLGMYLGDGYIVKKPRTYALRVFLDYKYPKIIERVSNNMKIIFPRNSVTHILKDWKGKHSCVELVIYNNNIPKKFPQHGPGKKHERPIVLESWQKVIVDKYSKQFLRGLFESDGSRYESKIKRKDNEQYYTYWNYNFTNVSLDITNLVIDTLKKLNISYRLQHKYGNRNHEKQYFITISKKTDVVFMDTFIGRKE